MKYILNRASFVGVYVTALYSNFQRIDTQHNNPHTRWGVLWITLISRCTCTFLGYIKPKCLAARARDRHKSHHRRPHRKPDVSVKPKPRNSVATMRQREGERDGVCWVFSPAPPRSALLLRARNMRAHARARTFGCESRAVLPHILNASLLRHIKRLACLRMAHHGWGCADADIGTSGNDLFFECMCASRLRSKQARARGRARMKLRIVRAPMRCVCASVCGVFFTRFVGGGCLSGVCHFRPKSPSFEN